MEASKNTTIACIATNVKLTKAQAQKIAEMAHDGMARAIRPSHTMFDGDTIFVLGTGMLDLDTLKQKAVWGNTSATSTSWEARPPTPVKGIVHAMLNADRARPLVTDKYRRLHQVNSINALCPGFYGIEKC